MTNEILNRIVGFLAGVIFCVVVSAFLTPTTYKIDVSLLSSIPGMTYEITVEGTLLPQKGDTLIVKHVYPYK